MSLIERIGRDIKAARERDPAASSNLEVIIAYPGFHARQLHRLAHTMHTHNVPIVPRLISHLNRLFKENTGFPPMAYLTHLRMIEACRLLDTTDWKVAAVAMDVGYSDPYHFSRVFSRVIGQSPRAYRNR